MQTIGLIGGMSWESTIVYYRLINEAVQKRLGGLHSARLLMHSFDFEEIAARQRADDWNGCTEMLVAAGQGLKAAGADALVICTNTMHLCAGAVERDTGLPLLHIADPLGRAVRNADLRRVGLLATRYTMENTEILRRRLRERFGIESFVPEGDEAATVHRIIFDELCRGQLHEASRAQYRDIIGGLVRRGAEGIVLCCTEIGLLIGPDDVSVPCFDTTVLHSQAAADFALGRA